MTTKRMFGFQSSKKSLQAFDGMGLMWFLRFGNTILSHTSFWESSPNPIRLGKEGSDPTLEPGRSTGLKASSGVGKRGVKLLKRDDNGLRCCRILTSETRAIEFVHIVADHGGLPV